MTRTRASALALLLGGAALGTWLLLSQDRSALAQATWRTDLVERGEVIEGVEASGTIQPLVLVQVGTQVSGVIETLCKDWSSPVRAGETIAVLDSRRLVAQVRQDEASLGRARADVTRAEALLWQAQRDLARLTAPRASEWVTQTELDAAEAALRTSRAQVEVAAAVVSQALAQLEGDRVNLAYATIRSPIDGVIVSRDVDVGQTVAASLQAPTLFVIANDLNRVQVQASVPEADIGRIREGQRVRFDVDAHPERMFQGVVSQVRLAGISLQNVVTYTVLVDAQNPEGLLLPGMTANATFELTRSPADGLKVPVSALRFEPPAELVAGPPAPAPGGGPEGSPARVYLPHGEGRLRAVEVIAGVSDGAWVAVVPLAPGALGEGQQVVIGVEAELESGGQNPFLPRFGAARGARQ